MDVLGVISAIKISLSILIHRSSKNCGTVLDQKERPQDLFALKTSVREKYPTIHASNWDHGYAMIFVGVFIYPAP